MKYINCKHTWTVNFFTVSRAPIATIQDVDVRFIHFMLIKNLILAFSKG